MTIEESWESGPPWDPEDPVLASDFAVWPMQQICFPEWPLLNPTVNTGNGFQHLGRCCCCGGSGDGSTAGAGVGDASAA